MTLFERKLRAAEYLAKTSKKFLLLNLGIWVLYENDILRMIINPYNKDILLEDWN